MSVMTQTWQRRCIATLARLMKLPTRVCPERLIERNGWRIGLKIGIIVGLFLCTYECSGVLVFLGFHWIVAYLLISEMRTLPYSFTAIAGSSGI